MTNRYLMHGGTYTNQAGQTFNWQRGKLTIVEDSLPLDEMFKGQFTLHATARVAQEEVYEEPQTLEAETDEAEDEGAEVTTPEGQNVTDEFPRAQEVELLVFKSGKRYFVYDPGDTRIPLHKEVYKNKQQVNTFLNKFGR